MSKALSLDLRQRALAALHDEGLSHREAAARFRVSAASISRWRALARDGSEPRPGPLGGDRRSHVIEAHAAAILAVFHARRDMTLVELQAELVRQGLRIDYEIGVGEALPYDDATFDAVICVDVLEHVRDLEQVLVEVARVLRPGGLFLFDTINRNPVARFAIIRLSRSLKAQQKFKSRNWSLPQK